MRTRLLRQRRCRGTEPCSQGFWHSDTIREAQQKRLGQLLRALVAAESDALVRGASQDNGSEAVLNLEAANTREGILLLGVFW